MHLALEMNFDNVVIADRSNNAGILGRSPQLPEANGGSVAEPPTLLTRFFSLLPKNTHF